MNYLKLLFLITIAFFSCRSEIKYDTRNLSFENVFKDSAIGWKPSDQHDSTRYLLLLDSQIAKHGHHSASISFTGGKPGFAAWRSKISEKYAGDSITLSGFIKTENVTEGYAGLILGLEPRVAFDNMSGRGVTGSADWTEYKITLPLNSQKIEGIIFGGLLVGKGKMWVDDLKISIDGVDIAKIVPVDSTTAYKDHEFSDGTQIKLKNLNTNQINTLYEIGLLWGFLKYYHPSVAKGDYNWDYELFRILPKILNLSTWQRNDFLYKWINSLGSIKTENKYATDSAVLTPDLNWIDHASFSNELRTLLLKVKNAERQQAEHYYVTTEKAGNAIFKNERPYSFISCNDDGFRLLALFRYWNMVQYFFPYKNLIRDWKETLSEFIPKFLNANTELQYKLTMLELTTRTHDAHAQVVEDYTLFDFFGTRKLPVNLQFIDEKLLITGYLSTRLGRKSGLEIGDIITKMNGAPVKTAADHLAQYTPSSNRHTLLRNIARNILRTNDTIINIEILRNGRKISLAATSYADDELYAEERHKMATSASYKWIEKGIAYIDHGKLKRRDVEPIFERFKDARGMIIDLRNYPSDEPRNDILSNLLPEQKPFVKKLIPDLDQPGCFYFTEPLRAGTKPYERKKDLYKGKLMLLIDESTQSASEFNVMAYQTYSRCVTIGTKTAGTDGNVSEIILPGNIKTWFSGVGIFYPDGRATQRIGIVPQIAVRPTVQAIIDGRDVVLEKAIELIKSN